MRIIAGELKGIKFKVPKNLKIRPTTDRAKESIFNILENHFNFPSISVLDLFSGTGSISFEFASRGSQKITAVEKNRDCIKHMTDTSKQLKLTIDIKECEVLNFLKKQKKKYNIIFADPPYKYRKHTELKDLILNKQLIHESGCLIIEHGKDTSFNNSNPELRKYGSVYFSIFYV